MLCDFTSTNMPIKEVTFYCNIIKLDAFTSKYDN